MPDPTEAQLIQEKLDKDTRAENAHKTWRYRYRAGGKPEGRLFDHPADVPEDDGWTDSPAKCQEPPAPRGTLPPVDPAPDAEGYGKYSTNPPAVNVEDMPTDEVSMAQIRARYTEVTGNKAKVGFTKAQIQAMIRDAA